MAAILYDYQMRPMTNASRFLPNHLPPRLIRFQKNCWPSSRHRISSPISAMAHATLSSSSLIFSASSCNCKSPSLSLPNFHLSSTPAVSSRSSSLFASSSSSAFLYPISKRSSFSSAPSSSSSSFNIVASAKKVLIINTNSGGHAIIGFYFAKQLLGCGHDVTVLTVGEESSDKMKKPPFSRFSVKFSKQEFSYFFHLNIILNGHSLPFSGLDDASYAT